MYFFNNKTNECKRQTELVDANSLYKSKQDCQKDNVFKCLNNLCNNIGNIAKFDNVKYFNTYNNCKSVCSTNKRKSPFMEPKTTKRLKVDAKNPLFVVDSKFINYYDGKNNKINDNAIEIIMFNIASKRKMQFLNLASTLTIKEFITIMDDVNNYTCIDLKEKFYNNGFDMLFYHKNKLELDTTQQSQFAMMSNLF